ncbi:MAG: YdeI family protein [Vulcanimicrobiota bacterium]
MTNPRVDDYLGKPRKWLEEMRKLRSILLGCGLTEEWKWRKPCYTVQDSNVVLILSFKATCALLFVKGALLEDPRDILIQPTESTQAARQMRFTGLEDIDESVVADYVRRAVEVEKAGLKVDFRPNPEPIPAELQTKLDQMPALKKAFESLTPGRQRGYILHFSGAKKSETRASRVEKSIPQILAGKGLND